MSEPDTEYLLEERGVRCVADLVNHSLLVEVRHFHGIQKRLFRLLFERCGASIQKLATDVGFFLVVIMKRWRILHVQSGGRVALAEQSGVHAFRGGLVLIRVDEGETGLMAGGARLSSGFGKIGVFKQPLT